MLIIDINEIIHESRIVGQSKFGHENKSVSLRMTSFHCSSLNSRLRMWKNLPFCGPIVQRHKYGKN